MTRYRSFPVSKNPLLFICTSDTDVGGTLGEKFPFENPLELGHKELWLNKCQLLLNIWCIVAFAEVSADHCGQKSSPNASETSSLQFLSCHFFIPHCVLVQRPVIILTLKDRQRPRKRVYGMGQIAVKFWTGVSNEGLCLDFSPKFPQWISVVMLLPMKPRARVVLLKWIIGIGIWPILLAIGILIVAFSHSQQLFKTADIWWQKKCKSGVLKYNIHAGTLGSNLYDVHFFFWEQLLVLWSEMKRTETDMEIF